MSAFAKVLTLVPLVILFLPNIASNSAQEFSSMNENVRSKRYVATNSSTITAGCDLKISQSAFKDVLKLMSSSKTNVIDLQVWIQSGNNTMNKTRIFAGIKWANEIGRTLISLIAQAKEPGRPMLLPYTRTMTAGIYGVNIVIAEETIRCLLSGSSIPDNVVFDALIHQLHHISGYETNYKLCRPHNDKNQVQKYNCCTIFGGDDILICSDYSSIMTKTFPTLVIATVIFVLIIDFPVILRYLRYYKEDDKNYRVSDSPTSLSFILHSIFIEGHGPAKFFGRKLTFVLFVHVTTLPEQGYWLGLWVYLVCAFLWSLLFIVFVDKVNFHREGHLKNPIEIIVRPFNLKSWWNKISTKWPRLFGRLTYSSIQQSEIDVHLHVQTAQEWQEEQPCLLQHKKKKQKKFGFFEIMAIYISVLLLFVFYFISLPFLCLFALCKLIWHNAKSVVAISVEEENPRKQDRFCDRLKSFFKGLLLISTFLIIFFSIKNLFFLAFYSTVGFFLNGETYSPYFVPLSTIIFYAWTSWRSSVETKYLVLVTNIYEVCHESVPVEGDERSNNTTENASNANNTSRSSTAAPLTDCFVIKLDSNGEPMIPKALYNSVREKFLPYDRILFHYFHGVLFIGIFAYLLFIMMSLAETSGISNSVRIIGTIAATTIPFIFNFVWKKNSDEQKAANIIALKSKLKRILLVHSSDDTTGEMVVELVKEGDRE